MIARRIVLEIGSLVAVEMRVGFDQTLEIIPGRVQAISGDLALVTFARSVMVTRGRSWEAISWEWLPLAVVRPA